MRWKWTLCELFFTSMHVYLHYGLSPFSYNLEQLTCPTHSHVWSRGWCLGVSPPVFPAGIRRTLCLLPVKMTRIGTLSGKCLGIKNLHKNYWSKFTKSKHHNNHIQSLSLSLKMFDKVTYSGLNQTNTLPMINYTLCNIMTFWERNGASDNVDVMRAPWILIEKGPLWNSLHTCERKDFAWPQRGRQQTATFVS